MKPLVSSLLILSISFSLSACSDDDSPETSPNSSDLVDVGNDASNAPVDMGDGEDADAGADDAGDDHDMADLGMTGCALPERMIAGDTTTDALATAPSACGAPAYQWIDVDQIGDVTQLGQSQSFTASLFTTVAQQQGFKLPRPAQYDVDVQVYGYNTQDRGQVVEASSMIATPVGLEGPTDILLLLHGTSGFNDDCAPSSRLGDRALAALIASMGYTVIAPDYIGLKSLGDASEFPHPYLVGESTAIASLDAVRAGMQLAAEDGQCLRPRIMTMGFSQGGHATLWVDRLGPYYAREFELLGAAAGTPPSDLLSAFKRALQSFVPASQNTVATLSTMASWYGIEDRLDEVFVSPLDVDIPMALTQDCSPTDVLGSDPTVEAVFTSEIIAASADPNFGDTAPWGCITRENSLTDTSIDRIESAYGDGYGILFILGEDDSLVVPEIERPAFDRLCEEQAMPLAYLECAGANHVEANVWALPEMLDFLDARAAGTPLESADTCARSAAVTCQGTPD